MRNIPNPRQVGLPPKFESWRDAQAESIRVMLDSPKRVTALSAPTGFGKSPAYVAFAILSGKPTCIVTNSRGLQDQLMRDYGEIGLVDLRGRSNYQCGMRDDYSCHEGYAARCPYKGSAACPAGLAEIQASQSNLVVTNYDKWTSSRRFGTALNHFEQVVFDEGHDAPDAIARAMQVLLTPNEIDSTLELDLPLEAASVNCWKIWSDYARHEAAHRYDDLKRKISLAVDPKPSWVREYYHLQNLIRRLSILATLRPQDWVVDETQMGFQFDPIRPARYSESILLQHIPRIIVVSATLRPKTLVMLGISKDVSDFYEFDSDFDPSKCPIYYVPTMRVDVRATDLSMLWVRLDQIAAKRRDRKGIIHTISYARRDDILKISRFAGSMIVNPKGEPATATVNAFRNCVPGTILVSPSVGTGYDFAYKDAEWQFIVKIPFPDGRTKINKARSEDDKEFGPYQAMQSLVQMAGRISRAKDDVGETFIPDMHMDWFIPRYSHLAPRSFKQFFRRVEVLPQPPERLT